MLDSRVLILNQNYEPISVCSARKAIVMLFLNKVEMVEHNHYWVHSVNNAIRLPSIVRLSRMVKIPKRKIILNRKNVIKRDNYECQYCGSTDLPLTVDHIFPKNRGGKDTWENLTCACPDCNSRKGNRTPEEAGMSLRRIPRKPGYIFFIQQLVGVSDERWKPYLFMS